MKTSPPIGRNWAYVENRSRSSLASPNLLPLGRINASILLLSFTRRFLHFIMLLGFAPCFGLCVRKSSLLLQDVTIPALQTIWMADSVQTLENVFCFISFRCVGFHKHHEIDWHIGNLTYLLNIAFVGNNRGCMDVIF